MTIEAILAVIDAALHEWDELSRMEQEITPPLARFLLDRLHAAGYEVVRTTGEDDQ